MVLKLDELNVLRSQPFDEYFGIMKLSPNRIIRRIEFADSFETLILTVLNMISIMLDYGSVDWNRIEEVLTSGYEEILETEIKPDDYTATAIKTYVNDFRKATEKVTEPVTPDTSLNIAWLLSADRARYNAENEANSIINYAEYKEAIEKGYTKKTWHTELDERVRPTHIPMEGKTIPIFEYFKVGSSYMLYPRDRSMFADDNEIVNCRCAVDFS